MICAMFGNLDPSKDIKDDLEAIIMDMAKEMEITRFYISGSTDFGRTVKAAWRQIRAYHPKREFSAGCSEVTAGLPWGEVKEYGYGKAPELISMLACCRTMIELSDAVAIYSFRTDYVTEMAVRMAINQGKKIVFLNRKLL